MDRQQLQSAIATCAQKLTQFLCWLGSDGSSKFKRKGRMRVNDWEWDESVFITFFCSSLGRIQVHNDPISLRVCAL